MKSELRFGRWQDVLVNVECDTFITDAPFSARTHNAHREGEGYTGSGTPTERTPIYYDSWTPDDVHECVRHFAPRTRGWFVTITDHVLAPAWIDALDQCDRYTFAPLPYIAPGSRVRLAGDGPANWGYWIVVARPTAMVGWGALPGGYILPPGHNDVIVIGGKPTWLMQALIRDYSSPDDVICDPCAGSGTTLHAARIEGRRFIGAECRADHHELARKRLSRGYTPTMFPELRNQGDPTWQPTPRKGRAASRGSSKG